MAESVLVPSSAIPKGFRFAATRAGIKASGRLDLACIVSDEPATAAAMFTSNKVVAAPVTVGREHMVRSGGRVRAVIVNAGNANCATGQPGIEACTQVCTAAADTFFCAAHEIFPSSTGIIGVLLPTQKLLAALPTLQASLGDTADDFMQFATAIMTTDTCAKAAFATVEIDGVEVRILGTTKGAGMIQPKLAAPHATMLAYLLTDAAVEPSTLSAILHGAAEHSFNRISIDGDTSTNDTVVLMASGAAGVAITNAAEIAAFQQALNEVCGFTRQADGGGWRRRRPCRRAEYLRRALAMPMHSPLPARSPTRRWSKPPGPAPIPTGVVSLPPLVMPVFPSIRRNSAYTLASWRSAVMADSLTGSMR